MSAGRASLDAHDAAYRWLVERVRAAARLEDPEEVLARVEHAAAFATWFHPGRFADGALENPALEIGRSLNERSRPGSAQSSGRPRVLHVTTRVFAVGGHTRMICHWILSDSACEHSIALVDQGELPVPRDVSAAVEASGGWLGRAEGGSRVSRAAWLRAAAASFDLVVLHHFAMDIVPTVAFAVPGGPPVAVLNHADHQFWLGSSVADVVINLRTAG